MSPRRPSKISTAFRKLKLRKQLAKNRLAEASPAQPCENPRPTRPQLRLVSDADIAEAAKDEDSDEG